MGIQKIASVHTYPHKSGYFDALVNAASVLQSNVILRYSLAPISLGEYWLRYRYVSVFENTRILPSTRRHIQSVFRKFHSGKRIRKVADSSPHSSNTWGRRPYRQGKIRLFRNIRIRVGGDLSRANQSFGSHGRFVPGRFVPRELIVLNPFCLRKTFVAINQTSV